MADNYLEKKFEEHINAPYSKETRKRPPVKPRRAVVTGGASSFGAAIARALRVAGHKVLIVDANAAAVAEVALRTGADYAVAAHADASAIRNALRSASSKWGGVDIVVAVSPQWDVQQPLDASLGVAGFGSALTAAVCPLLVAAQHMKAEREADAAARGFGRIVAVAGTAGDSWSRVADAAVAECAKNCAAELAPYGITVNVVRSNGASADAADAHPDDKRAGVRAATPDDVAKTVRFVVDEKSDFLDGMLFDCSFRHI